MIRLIATTVISVLAFSASSFAQSVPYTPEVYPAIDGNGVDLVDGSLHAASPTVAIGGVGGLSYTASMTNNNYRTDSIHGYLILNGGSITMVLGGRAERFIGQSCNPSPCTTTAEYHPVVSNGGKIVRTLATNVYVYTTGNGTEIEFDDDYANWLTYDSTYADAMVTRITTPTGEEMTYHYRSATVTPYDPFGNPQASQTVYRLQSVRNNRGYQLFFTYGHGQSSYDLDPNGFDIFNFIHWQRLDSVAALNMAYQRCADTAATCAMADNWPTLNITSTGGNAEYELFGDNIGLPIGTPDLSLTTRYSYSSARLSGIRGPGGTMDDIQFEYCSVSDVSNGDCETTTQVRRVRLTGQTSGTSDDIVTTYTYDAPALGYTPVDASNDIRQISTPDGATTILEFNTNRQLVRVQTSKGAVTTYSYDSNNRVTVVDAPHTTSATDPYENSYLYTYDLRGNITRVELGTGEEVFLPGGGSIWIASADATVWEAAYPESSNSVCTSPITCNLPTSTTEAGRGTTSYTWNSTHGGLLTQTLPAPETGMASPLIEFNYAQYEARYRPSPAGSIQYSGEDIYLPYLIESCAIGALSTCAAVNIRNQYAAYGYQGSESIGNHPNNLGVSVSRVYDGQSSTPVTSETQYSFNRYGMVATVDGPQSGTVDRTFLYYDTLGRPIGQVGADPDGGGALLRRASVIEYDTRGRAYETYTGTATSQPANDLGEEASVSRLASTVAVFDGFSRVVRNYSYLTNGATHTITSLVEHSFETNTGLPECTAIRLADPGTTTLPPATNSGACTPNTSDGDLVTHTDYDSHGRIYEVTTGHGYSGTTPETVRYTYHDNGLVQTIRDAELREMTYLYDVRNRLLSVVLPDPGSGSMDPANDIALDTRTYNVHGQLTAYQDYAGQQFNYTYDNLGRLIFVNAPGTLYDLDLTYNNHGQVLTATNGAWYTLTNTFDGIGRQLTQANAFSTLRYTYDAASRRSSMQWDYAGSSPNEMTIEYDYLVTGEIEEIREATSMSGWSVLANYTYDNNGWRTGVDRPSSAPDTAYTYNSRGLLATLRHGPSGTPIVEYDYTYDGAGRITRRTTEPFEFGYTGNSTFDDADTCFDYRNRNEGTPTVTPATPSNCATLQSTQPDFDTNGNLTEAEDGRDWAFDAFNRLATARDTAGAHGTDGNVTGTYNYDPQGRLYTNNDTSEGQHLYEYDGANLIGVYDNTTALDDRYVHGPGIDNPIVRYTDDTNATREWILADERGSVVAYYNASGVRQGAINTYDEYGERGSSNHGLFQYAGRPWLNGARAYDNRNRAYNPELGRFLQIDPIGQEGGLNIYNYAGSDPVNFTDPTGLAPDPSTNPWRPGCYDFYNCDQYWRTEGLTDTYLATYNALEHILRGYYTGLQFVLRGMSLRRQRLALSKQQGACALGELGPLEFIMAVNPQGGMPTSIRTVPAEAGYSHFTVTLNHPPMNQLSGIVPTNNIGTVVSGVHIINGLRTGDFSTTEGELTVGIRSGPRWAPQWNGITGEQIDADWPINFTQSFLVSRQYYSLSFRSWGDTEFRFDAFWGRPQVDIYGQRRQSTC